METTPTRATQRTMQKVMNDHRRLLGQFANIQRRLQAMQWETEKGGNVQVKRGTPQDTHPGDGVATETYNIDGGGTQADVINATTVEALTTNSYWLFLIGTQWHSFPAQLDLCNPTNPIQ